jgi:hypothetical protein
MKWWKYAKFVTLKLSVVQQVKILLVSSFGCDKGIVAAHSEFLWCLGILKRIISNSMVLGYSSKDFMGFFGLWGTRILLHSECVKLFQPIEIMLYPNDPSFYFF